MQNFDFEMSIPILILAEYSTQTFFMGYHDYQNVWVPEIGELLEAKMEPTNTKDMFYMCVLKHDKVVGHLMKGTTGRYAKKKLFSPG